jgi:hypothetical protein
MMQFGAIFLFSLSIAQAQLPAIVSKPAEKHIIKPIGPQTWHRQIFRPAPGLPFVPDEGRSRWAIHVVEFDVRSPLLQLETVKAGNQLQGKEQTSRMAARADREGHRVVAAINGDFYDISNGAPINLQLRGGEILRQPTSRSVFAISAAEKPVINFLSLIGKLQSKQSAWQPLHGFNRTRNADELIFFNHYFGATTGTNNFGSEARLRPLEKFAVNDTFCAVVRELHRSIGNAPLDDSTYIISAHGAAENWLLLNLATGDTVKLIWRIPETTWQLVEAIGGLPRIVRNGNISIESEREGGSASFTNNRHPRSAIGFNADTSRFFFVTVDGRQPGYSEGMTLPELAAFMRELGCTQALNLDGGGSTTMVVRNKVVNRPSDATGERAVANALLLISTAPTGPLAYLEVQPREVALHPGEQLDFSVTAADSFYNPLDLADEDVFWKVSAPLGSIDSRGLFTANSKLDSGYVVAFRSQVHDSVRIVVRRFP